MKRYLNQAPVHPVFSLIVATAIAAVSVGCGGKSRDAREVANAQAVEAAPMRSMALPVQQPGYFGDEFRDVESRLSYEPVENSSPTF